MKIIQICGTNGTGKTTLVKNLLRSGKFLRMTVLVDGKDREWWYDGKIAIVGKYNANNTCGIDAGGYTSDALIHTVEHLLHNYQPETLMFEDVMRGHLFSFKAKMHDTAERFGYSYCVFTLIASLSCCVQRVIERTGNENINVEILRAGAMGVINSSRRIAKLGAYVVFVDTEQNTPNDVLALLRRVINEQTA